MARRDTLTGREKFLLFWGHKAPADKRVGEWCLSQWAPRPFVVDGVRYPTAEHYMMAGKARLFGDLARADQALAARSPAEAKRCGRAVTGFDERRWVAERERIVFEANLAKFGQHDDLRAFLLGTGKKVLVEASPADRVWGIGLAADHQHARVPSRWRGLNLLGFALVDVRTALARRR